MKYQAQLHYLGEGLCQVRIYLKDADGREDRSQMAISLPVEDLDHAEAVVRAFNNPPKPAS